MEPSEPQSREQILTEARDKYTEWVKDGFTYEIDLGQGERGVAHRVRLGDSVPSLSEWLDEYNGEFVPAEGWTTYADEVRCLTADPVLGDQIVDECRNPICCTPEAPTRKVIVDVLGHEVNSKRLILEVPAHWTDEDISKVSGEDLDDCWRDWDIDGDDGVIVQDEIRIGPTVPDDVASDFVVHAAESHE